MEENKLPKELYHYTSLETFYNIIKGKELWFFESITNYDKDEFTFFEKKLKEVFKQQFNFDCREIGRAKISPDYSLSLTSEEDSFFHFHKYANENTGVCICFDTEAFTSALKNLYHINKGNIIDAVPMSYQNDSELGKYIIQEINKTQEIFSFLKINNETNVENMLEKLHYSIYIRFAKIIKRENYKIENEYRFFYNGMIAYINILLNSLNNDGYINNEKNEELRSIIKQVNEKLRLKEDFVCANGKIRRCCQINIAPIINQNIISKIIIGSKCKNSVDDIKAFLEYNNVHVAQVVSSQINID